MKNAAGRERGGVGDEPAGGYFTGGIGIAPGNT
jgi:hypothetical protein